MLNQNLKPTQNIKGKDLTNNRITIEKLSQTGDNSVTFAELITWIEHTEELK